MHRLTDIFISTILWDADIFAILIFTSLSLGRVREGGLKTTIRLSYFTPHASVRSRVDVALLI